MLSFLRNDLASLSAYQADSADHSDLPVDKLDANEVSIDLPAWFKQKLAAIAERAILANRYPDGEYYALKVAIAKYVGQGISSEQVSIGNGSDEIIRSLLMVSCLHRGGILVAEPTFSMYGILAQTLGVATVKVPRLADFSINIEQANQAIASQNIAAVFLVHPNSPTGNLLTKAELAWVRSLSPEILVVIDEAYFEFSGQTVVAELAAHPNWVVLRTFSKALRLAAYRVGYAIAHPEIILALEKVRLPYNLPTPSYHAAMLALANADELLANIPEIQQERDRLFQAFTTLGLEAYPSAGNYIYLRTSRDGEILKSLQQQGTLIRQTGGGLRITIGTSEQNQRTLERLKKLVAHN